MLDVKNDSTRPVIDCVARGSKRELCRPPAPTVGSVTAFSVAAAKAWNSLPTHLKTAACSMDAFTFTSLEDMSSQKGLRLTLRLLLLQIFIHVFIIIVITFVNIIVVIIAIITI